MITCLMTVSAYSSGWYNVNDKPVNVSEGRNMQKWREFRFWYATAPKPDDLFVFKRDHLVPILEKHNIEDFLMLDEPKFLLLRVAVDEQLAKQIESSLKDAMQSESIFSNLTMESWSPVTDARERILAARKRANVPEEIPEGGWMITGKAADGKWIPVPEDLDRQVSAFSSFMSRVVGKFTKAYLKEMPYRVEDRWLMSVFLHLASNSISVWQKQENESREFPYV